MLLVGWAKKQYTRDDESTIFCTNQDKNMRSITSASSSLTLRRKLVARALLETSKFSLHFSGSSINLKLSYYWYCLHWHILNNSLTPTPENRPTFLHYAVAAKNINAMSRLAKFAIKTKPRFSDRNSEMACFNCQRKSQRGVMGRLRVRRAIF